MSEKLWLSKFTLSVSKAMAGYTSGCAFLFAGRKPDEFGQDHNETH